MLTGKDLGYDIGSAEVFAHVDIAVSPSDKVGLIGPNGAGKTTLLHILNQDIAPSHGVVTHDSVEVGILPQDLRSHHDRTVYDFVEEVTGVKAVKDAYTETETAFMGDQDNQKKLIRYVEASERLGFYAVDEFDATLSKALRKAGLDESITDSAIGSLSGGQRTRVALAALMANRYDVVLLDEPTNNLDMAGVSILETYVQTSRAAFLMVSHDRRFLRNTTNRIVELLGSDRGVNNYGLGYDEYVVARERAYDSQVRNYEEHSLAVKSLETSLKAQRVRANSAEGSGTRARSDNDKLSANHRAARAAGHLSGQLSSMTSRLAQLQAEAPHPPQEPVSLEFMFEEGEYSRQTLLRVEHLVAAYDESGVTHGPYNLDVRGGDRVAITGANGSGKSTLIKAILGEIDRVSGDCHIGSAAQIAYIDQNQTLPKPEATPLDNLLALAPGIERSDAMNLLVKFNLDRDTVASMQAGNLSGGERAKVLLASVAASKANLLLLDEPTNNLDIPTIEGLQAALKTYKGAIVLVSHDRDFIDGIDVTNVLSLASH